MVRKASLIIAATAISVPSQASDVAGLSLGMSEEKALEVLRGYGKVEAIDGPAKIFLSSKYAVSTCDGVVTSVSQEEGGLREFAYAVTEETKLRGQPRTIYEYRESGRFSKGSVTAAWYDGPKRQMTLWVFELIPGKPLAMRGYQAPNRCEK